MKRSSFFAALAAFCGIGVARGQVPISTCAASDQRVCDALALQQLNGIGVMKPSCHSSVRPRSLDYGCKPGNNECPTCGTMAEPYKLAEALAAKKREWCEAGFSSEVISEWCAEANAKTGVPQSRVTRCSYCNAAFYQDGE